MGHFNISSISGQNNASGSQADGPAPEFRNFRQPEQYARALEKQYKNDPEGLYKKVMSEPDRNAYKAALDHSEVLRDYLGVSSNHSARKLNPWSKTNDKTIDAFNAPYALCSAAVRFDSVNRQKRSLDRLRDTLAHTHIRSGDSTNYENAIADGFKDLLQNLDKLGHDTLKQQALVTILQHTNNLSDKRDVHKVAEAAREAMGKPGLKATEIDLLQQVADLSPRVAPSNNQRRSFEARLKSSSGSTSGSTTLSGGDSSAARSEGPAPRFDQFRNPQDYARALEQRYKDKPAELYAQLRRENNPSAFKAALEHSEVLRDYLGVSNQQAFRKRHPLAKKQETPTIDDLRAPSALGAAAVQFDSARRQKRTLDRLWDTLDKTPPQAATSGSAADYHHHIGDGFTDLLNNLGQLRDERLCKQALATITRHTPNLDARDRDRVAQAAGHALKDVPHGSSLHTLLQDVANMGSPPRHTSKQTRETTGTSSSRRGSFSESSSPSHYSSQGIRAAYAMRTQKRRESKDSGFAEVEQGQRFYSRQIEDLRDHGFSDGHLQTLKATATACAYAAQSGDQVYLRFAAEEFERASLGQVKVPNPSDPAGYQHLIDAINQDLNFRNAPDDLVRDLKNKGVPLEALRNSIHQCSNVARQGTMQMVPGTFGEFNKQYYGLLPTMDYTSLQQFEHLAGAIDRDLNRRYYG